MPYNRIYTSYPSAVDLLLNVFCVLCACISNCKAITHYLFLIKCVLATRNIYTRTTPVLLWCKKQAHLLVLCTRSKSSHTRFAFLFYSPYCPSFICIYTTNNSTRDTYVASQTPLNDHCSYLRYEYSTRIYKHFQMRRHFQDIRHTQSNKIYL